jgi:hypothetical protein
MQMPTVVASATRLSTTSNETRSSNQQHVQPEGHPVHDDATNQSKPISTVWVADNQVLASKRDHSTVVMVVSESLFRRVKFVDADVDLLYDEHRHSICGFVARKCNVVENQLDVKVWWKEARKWVRDTISRMRNDKTTAIKWEFLGKYRSFVL